MTKRIGLWCLVLAAAPWACDDESGDDGVDDGGGDVAETTDEGGSADDGIAPDDGEARDEATSPDVTPGDPMPDDSRIIYLHHSTGGVIWGGGVPEEVAAYNTSNGTSYDITERAFPSGDPYPWENYPYDYWNIWVNHAGSVAYLEEPTLELLTPDYGVIVFKHCFPVSGIGPDTGSPDVASAEKTLENYRLQYEALETKLHEFPGNRFLLWTGAALTAASTSAEDAARAREFFTWVKDEWDEPGDNIFVWDFFELETEGGNVLLDSNAASSGDSHPNDAFAARVAPLFVGRLVSVLRGTGDSTSLTGE